MAVPVAVPVADTVSSTDNNDATVPKACPVLAKEQEGGAGGEKQEREDERQPDTPRATSLIRDIAEHFGVTVNYRCRSAGKLGWEGSYSVQWPDIDLYAGRTGKRRQRSASPPDEAAPSSPTSAGSAEQKAPSQPSTPTSLDAPPPSSQEREGTPAGRKRKRDPQEGDADEPRRKRPSSPDVDFKVYRGREGTFLVGGPQGFMRTGKEYFCQRSHQTQRGAKLASALEALDSVPEFSGWREVFDWRKKQYDQRQLDREWRSMLGARHRVSCSPALIPQALIECICGQCSQDYAKASVLEGSADVRVEGADTLGLADGAGELKTGSKCPKAPPEQPQGDDKAWSLVLCGSCGMGVRWWKEGCEDTRREGEGGVLPTPQLPPLGVAVDPSPRKPPAKRAGRGSGKLNSAPTTPTGRRRGKACN